MYFSSLKRPLERPSSSKPIPHYMHKREKITNGLEIVNEVER